MSKDELARIDRSNDEPQRVEIIRGPRQDLSIDELMLIAEQAVRSGLYAESARNPSAAFMLALRCQAEGIHPGLAFAQFHVIEGRPTLRADAMQARYQQAGGRMRWLRSDNEVCEAEFWHPTLMPDPIRIRKTLAEYRASGLTRGPSGDKRNWKLYPDAMLRARVLSAGIRAVMPAVVCGLYTPEEMADISESSSVAPSSAPPPPPARPTASQVQEIRPLADDHKPVRSFRDFCKEVESRGYIDALGVCEAIITAAGEVVPPEASAKEIGRAAKAIWDRDPDRAMQSAMMAEAHAYADEADEAAGPFKDDDLPDFDDADDADQVDPAPEPGPESEADHQTDADIDTSTPRGQYLAWVQHNADAEGLEPIDILRIVHDAGVKRKAITAVSDRDDIDMLTTRGLSFWVRDPEAAAKAIDMAVEGDGDHDPRSKADRVADEL